HAAWDAALEANVLIDGELGTVGNDDSRATRQHEHLRTLGGDDHLAAGAVSTDHPVAGDVDATGDLHAAAAKGVASHGEGGEVGARSGGIDRNLDLAGERLGLRDDGDF